MEPIAVGGLDDRIVRILYIILLPQNGQVHIPQISAENHLSGDPVLRKPQLYGGRAQKVPRIDKPDFRPLRDLEPLVHLAGAEPLQAVLGIRQVVDGRFRLQTGPGRFPGFPLGLLHLDMGTVHQHNGTEVRGFLRRVDAAPEPVLGQQRQKARMVNMGMGQQHIVQLRRAHGQTLIFKAVLALLHPAVHQAHDAAALHHGAGACHLMGRAQKC